MTETDEDGNRRRRRQTKTEADEDGDRWRRIRTHSGNERTGSSLTADDTPEWTQNLILLLSCDPLTPEPMKVAAVSAAAGPVSRPWTCFQKKRKFMKRWQSLSLCQLVWQKTNYKTFGTRVVTERRLLFFIPNSPLCRKYVMFPWQWSKFAKLHSVKSKLTGELRPLVALHSHKRGF